jgi:deoxycytidylate deaminase
MSIDPALLFSELFFGIARPIGTATSELERWLTSELEQARFFTHPIEISQLLNDVQTERQGAAAQDQSEYDRYLRLMAEGDFLRWCCSPAVGAQLAIREISRRRPDVHKKARLAKMRGVVYVIGHLMHPQEVILLREVYGNRFVLLGVFGDDAQRREHLKTKLMDSGESEAAAKAHLEHLIDIDAGKQPSSEYLPDGSHLNLDKTFHRADLFLAPEQPAANGTLARFLDQVFSCPFGTPTASELAMGFAYLAAHASGALARSVGAAIIDPDWNLQAIGWNDPAAPFGGLCRDTKWAEHRENKKGRDPSDAMRVDAILHFINVLLDASTWKSPVLSTLPKDVQTWFEAFAKGTAELPKATTRIVQAFAALPNIAPMRLLNLIEFGGTVHAEMAAITDAARRGVSILGSSMYVTTFPCHECARNIVAAGIARVVYVEPYGKSLAPKLYGDTIEFCSTPTEEPVGTRPRFVPFNGIAPSRFDVYFSTETRKLGFAESLAEGTEPGERVRWNTRLDGELRRSIVGYHRSGQAPIPAGEVTYIAVEQNVVKALEVELKVENWPTGM